MVTATGRTKSAREGMLSTTVVDVPAGPGTDSDKWRSKRSISRRSIHDLGDQVR